MKHSWFKPRLQKWQRPEHKFAIGRARSSATTRTGWMGGHDDVASRYRAAVGDHSGRPPSYRRVSWWWLIGDHVQHGFLNIAGVHDGGSANGAGSGGVCVTDCPQGRTWFTSVSVKVNGVDVFTAMRPFFGLCENGLTLSLTSSLRSAQATVPLWRNLHCGFGSRGSSGLGSLWTQAA
jgi:hypothetical protein